jgi:hypothetical protein
MKGRVQKGGKYHVYVDVNPCRPQPLAQRDESWHTRAMGQSATLAMVVGQNYISDD